MGAKGSVARKMVGKSSTAPPGVGTSTSSSSNSNLRGAGLFGKRAEPKRPFTVGQPCFVENQNLWWWDLPTEIQMMIFQFLSVYDLSSVCLVNKSWLIVCDNNMLWETLFKRDFGEAAAIEFVEAELPEEREKNSEEENKERNAEKEGEEVANGCLWMRRYKDALSLPEWDRKISNPVLTLSHDNRWADRNGGGAFPKAISTAPVGLSPRPILLSTKDSSEFGLFVGQSGAEVLEKIDNVARSNHWPTVCERFELDFVFFSKMGAGFKYKIDGTYQSIPPPDNVNTNFDHTLQASISIFRRRGQVEWTLDGVKTVTPLPTAGPLYLVYSTGCSYGYCHLHLRSFDEKN